ncbi:MAG: response regulator [Patescibacteria group bacterium]
MAYKILLIDDNEDIRKYYKNIFVENGLDVIESKDGLDGLAKANQEHFDLIMTGIQMPKMNGFEFIEKLRQNPQTSEVPLIMFSHLGRKVDIEKANEMEIRDFVIKGFTTPRELVSLIIKRIESEHQVKEYLIDINEFKKDAPELIHELGLSASLKCPKHSEEKLVLLLIEDSKHVGEFKAKIVCPQKQKS